MTAQTATLYCQVLCQDVHMQMHMQYATVWAQRIGASLV